ncbi:MAG TPA: ribonuclease III [Lentisphaeria bacterium]|nr:ribonuclease III [Lentisphaeria bacterium]
MKNFNIKKSELPSILQGVQIHCGYLFRNRALLEESLTHPSYAVEQTPSPPHNQRLEFLGDSVLQIILSEYLYEHLPYAQEGLLTKVRSMLANESATAGYALQLGLDTVLLLGRGEILNGGRERPSILGDLFEAFLGAVYLDGGLQAARSLCLALLPDINTCLERLTFEDNPKGALQEYCQTHLQQKPVYERLGASGPKHEQVFEVKVCLGQRELARGQGSNNRLAERNAAQKALKTLISPADAPPMPQFYKEVETEVVETTSHADSSPSAAKRRSKAAKGDSGELETAASPTPAGEGGVSPAAGQEGHVLEGDRAGKQKKKGKSS